jgi:hypothetical protein
MTDVTNPPESTPIESARAGRANQFRQARRQHSSLFVPALLIMAFGVLLLLPVFEVIPILPGIAWLGIALGAFSIGLLARFMVNGRRESGLAFMGLLILLWLACAASFLSGFISLLAGWPIFIVAVGSALFFTMALERDRDRALALPGIVFLWAGGVALVFTMQIISITTLYTLATLWPFAFVLIALALLPRVFRAP